MLVRPDIVMKPPIDVVFSLSDPKAGEDALGRMFNGLAAAYDFKQKGVEVGIYFQGQEPAGPVSWPSPNIQFTRSTRPSKTRSRVFRVAAPMCSVHATKRKRSDSI